MGAAVHRRTVLAGGLALAAGAVVAGCADPAEPVRSSDLVALDTAARLEAALAQAAASVSPATAATRSAARAHRAHVEALVAAGALPPAASTIATAPSTPASAAPTQPSPTGTSQPAPLPDPSALVRVRTTPELAQAQRAVADAVARLALPVSPALAPLLGSVAASDAAHAAVVGGSAA
jgi:hypothetical protein